MSDRQTCTVCDRPVEAPTETDGGVRLCERCEGAVRELSGGGRIGPPDSDVVEYRPIGREYTPESGELVYLGSERQFYRVGLAEDVADSGPMIYLEPVPGAASDPVPITELSDEIGAAMDDDAFYRATIDPEAILEHELWWRTVAARAPERGIDDGDGERGNSENDEHGSDDDGDGERETDQRGHVDDEDGSDDGARGEGGDEKGGDISIPEAIDEEWEDRSATDGEGESDSSESLDLD